MTNGRDTQTIKRIRNELLVVLKMLYPGALQAEQIMRSLLVLFPTLDFDQVKRDLHYLSEKGYLERVIAVMEDGNGLTPWRKRWFRLTTRGVEVADRCINDPALDG